MSDIPPVGTRQNYLSYVNLVYLLFLILPLIFSRDVESKNIIATAIGIVLFLPLHFLTYRFEGRRLLWLASAQMLLCLAVLPFNPGANTFLIYAVIAAGYGVDTRTSVIFLAVSILAYSAESSWLGYPFIYTLSSAILCCVFVFYAFYGRQMAQKNHSLKLSQQEVQRLAQSAERERIARDLHDMLGHTMSLIVMKSELARRVFPRDAAEALVHIADVEKIARQSLDQIRSAVSGFRSATLESELASARLSLLSANIQLDYRLAPMPLNAETESALAMIVRESITNIIRHANAQQVEIELEHLDTRWRLRISDNGKGGNVTPGNGLNGIRERAQALGGDLALDKSASGGLRLTIECPLRENLASA